MMMTKSPPKQESSTELIYDTKEMIRQLDRRHSLKRREIYMAMYILMYLYENTKACSQDISRSLDIAAPQVSRHVSKMVRKGMVQKVFDSTDSRKRIIKLSLVTRSWIKKLVK